MTPANQTSTRSKDEIRIFAPWAYSLFTIVFLTIAVLFVTVVGMDPKAPASSDPMPVGNARGSRARLLRRADRLRQPGRRSPRHEPPALDADRHLCPQRPRHRPLFCVAQAPRGHMSTMQCRSRARLQLLPALPQPPTPRLPTLPTQRRPRRQILPLLRWDPRAGCRSDCPASRPATIADSPNNSRLFAFLIRRNRLLDVGTAALGCPTTNARKLVILSEAKARRERSRRRPPYSPPAPHPLVIPSKPERQRRRRRGTRCSPSAPTKNAARPGRAILGSYSTFPSPWQNVKSTLVDSSCRADAPVRCP